MFTFLSCAPYLIHKMPNSDNVIHLLISQAERLHIVKTTGTALGNQAAVIQPEKIFVCEFCLLFEFFLSNLNILFSLNLMFQILNRGILLSFNRISILFTFLWTLESRGKKWDSYSNDTPLVLRWYSSGTPLILH